MLIPCRPAAFDLDAIEATRDRADIAKKPEWVFLSSAPTRSGITGEAKRGLEDKGAKVSPVVLHLRVAYSHSVINGRTALEYEPAGRAAEEVRALLDWPCRQLGIKPRRRAHSPREGNMAKRSSLFGSSSASAPPKPAEPAPALAVEATSSAPATGKYPVAKTREGKRVATVYLEPEALKALQRLAIDEDTSLQALLVEGVNAVFQARGMSRIP